MLIKNNLENHIRYYYYKKNHRKGKKLMGTPNRKHWLRARIIIDDGG
jgi:hypothetical protein